MKKDIMHMRITQNILPIALLFIFYFLFSPAGAQKSSW